jgi:hypothetical protein
MNPGKTMKKVRKRAKKRKRGVGKVGFKKQRLSLPRCLSERSWTSAEISPVAVLSEGTNQQEVSETIRTRVLKWAEEE